jgi:hypothetical protein
VSTRRNISVTRSYEPDAGACLQALTTLLKKPAKHEGSPTPATLDNDGTIVKEDSAFVILPDQSQPA